MKVLQISNVHHIRGGADKVYFDTAELLKENGHQVSFFSSKNPDNIPSAYEDYFVNPVDYFERKGPINKLNAAIRYIHFPQAAKNLDRLLSDHLPDIAHLHIFQNQLSNAILPVLKKHRIPVVMSVHEYKMLCPIYTFLDQKGQVCEKCAGSKYYNCFTKKCNKGQSAFSALASIESYIRDAFIPYEKYIDHFLMVSHFIRNKHVEFKSVLEGKSSCLYNFIDIETYSKNHDKEDYYLYFGRLSREKGLLTLLRAFQKMPHLRLKVVGDGAMKPLIEELIQTEKINNVEMLGFKSGEALKAIIGKAKFAMVPSEWYETFGLIIIEAMALGTPVIAAKIGAIPELVQSNFNGFLFEHKEVDQLCEVVHESENLGKTAYDNMVKNARRFVEDNFLKEVHYKQLVSTYKQVIENYGKN